MESSNDQKTIWCGNVAEEVTEEILYELFLQAGPLERVSIPKDTHGRQCTYGFVTFKHEVSVPYATELLNGIRLYNLGLRLRPRGQQQANNQRVLYIQNNQRSPLYTPNSQRMLRYGDSPVPLLPSPPSYDDRRSDRPYGQHNRNQRGQRNVRHGNHNNYYRNRR